jgi:putative spermidine/putrescine transport system ATP-binding protein
MSCLSLLGLGRTDRDRTILADLSVEVDEGELLVLLGPPGSGKSATMRMIAGLDQPTAGDIRLDGHSILGLPPHRRDMGVVFDDPMLFPHLRVAGNVGFGLDMRRPGRRALRERVTQMLRMTRLEKFAAHLPRDLAPEQQLRAALARALAIQPRVLLLDSPLRTLPANLRQELARDIRLLQTELGQTTVLATRDPEEAMAMADQVVVLRHGRAEQIGTQGDLYERPATPFVAGFIGRNNILPGLLTGAATVVADGAQFCLAGSYPSRGPCTLALRPERLSLRPPDGQAPRPGSVGGTVELAVHVGAVREHLVRVGPELCLVVRQPTGYGATQFTAGAPATVRWDTRAERVFDAADRPLENQRSEPGDLRLVRHV